MFALRALITAVVLSSVYCNWGPFRAFLYSDWISCNHDKAMDYYVGGVDVYFYDFKNDFNLTFKIDEAAEGITKSYNLDITRKLIFFVPGYKSNIYKRTEEMIRQTFKDVPNIYLIIIDHSTYTSSRNSQRKTYESAVMYTTSIGRKLGSFLADMHSKGYPSNMIHCVGHSLGAQILGYAGATYMKQTLEKVWRITGIDPAGPCFSNSLIENQIRSGVAEYVEVYHCNAGGLGTTAVLADVDFFFNKGVKQPDCHEGYIPAYGESEAAKCSHKACVKFWLETVHHPGWYLAWACDSYEDFSSGKCAANKVTIAGYANPGDAKGVFYVSTDAYVSH